MHLNDWQTPKGERVKVLRNAADIQAHYAEKAPDTEPIRLDDYLRGVAKLRTTDAVRAALSTGTDTAGGFTVPSTVMPQILSALMPASAVLQAGAVIIPLAEGVKSMTIAAIDQAPVASWRAEGGSVAESNPTFRAVTAVPKDLSFMVKVSRELLADSPNMAQALATVIAEAAAAGLDLAALTGDPDDGGPTGLRFANVMEMPPVGVWPYGCSYTTFAQAHAKLRSANAPAPTAALVSPDVYAYLLGAVSADLKAAEKPPLLERMKFVEATQIFSTPVEAPVAIDSDSYVGDFSLLGFVMREALTIQPLTELYAGTGQLAFMVHMRADVIVQRPNAFVRVPIRIRLG